MNKYQQIDGVFAVFDDDADSIPIESASALVDEELSLPNTMTSDAKVEPKIIERKSLYLRPILVTIFLSLAILCGYFALPTPTSVAVSTPTTHTVKKIVTKGIEDIHCGERVLGKNPVLSAEDRKLFGAEPTRETHYEYFFALPKEDNTLTFVTLLRPRDWLEQSNELVREFEAETETGEKENGIVVWLELPEMGSVGWAELLAINDDFEVKQGKGNVVTGTFVHLANNVIDLKIEGQDSIGCTYNHPFWSVDRQEYIPAGKLQNGERILLYSGETKRVEQVLPRPGPELVYNIEVFGEHVYYVSQDGVLVHNSCLSDNMKKAGVYRPGSGKDYQAHHIVPQRMSEAKEAIKIMNKYKIMNSHWNGVYLPTKNAARGTIHLGGHSKDYAKKIEALITDADAKGGKIGVLRELQKIRNALASGNMPL